MIKKILVANRGEIAVRVIKACKELSISTVAVYSEADPYAPHVQIADEAYLLGPPPPLESYLNIDKIISITKETGAQAIHPGYGFLAENAQFAKRCEEEGILFIGPNSSALKLVGDKIASRKTISRAGIPIIPGMKQKGRDVETLKKEADSIGYPVLIKASAGGGGKGMRVVYSANELLAAIEAGRREAKSAFGDDSVYLEKFIEEPRHIEFQVLADNHGNAVHLYERECSIQRRYQKIVEETPSVALDNELRKKMGEVAVTVVKSCNYSNAGTVEFLLDKNKNFYFLEVNARIQVEHPITELVTGVDLVKQQIHIASGEKLTFGQEDVSQRGHAIECRIYAEDPFNDFLPSFGKILYVHEPIGPGIRNDSGLFSGIEIPMHYDPLLAKLITWGENRDHARKRMAVGLSEYAILGIQTQIPFLKAVINHPQFIDGNTTTDFIPHYMSDWQKEGLETQFRDKALMVAALDMISHTKRTAISQEKQTITPWQTIGDWEIGRGNH